MQLSPEDFSISATMPDGPAALPLLDLFNASFTIFSVMCYGGLSIGPTNSTTNNHQVKFRQRFHSWMPFMMPTCRFAADKRLKFDFRVLLSQPFSSQGVFARQQHYLSHSQHPVRYYCTSPGQKRSGSNGNKRGSSTIPQISMSLATGCSLMSYPGHTLYRFKYKRLKEKLQIQTDTQ